MTRPTTASDIDDARRENGHLEREIDEPPVFAVGDTVRVKSNGVPGHTRLPAYARGRRGIVEAHHGAHDFPMRMRTANIGRRRFTRSVSTWPRGLTGPEALPMFRTPTQGRVAQLAEHLTFNQRVRGSNPRAPTNLFKGLEENR